MFSVIPLHPLLLRRLLAGFLVVATLVFGVAESVLAVADMPLERASTCCLADGGEARSIGLDSLSAHDAGSEAVELDQLPTSPAMSRLVLANAEREFPRLAARLPWRVVPPLLRPPSIV